MNTSTDFDRIAQDWLQDGPTELPDRTLQAALDEVHVTSQQRFGAARRTFDMNGNWFKLAAAAVVVILIIGGGLAFLGGNQGGVGAGPSTAPATPTPTPTASPSPARTLAPIPGPTTARLEPFGQVGAAPASISVTVPPGWAAEEGSVHRTGMDLEPLLIVWQISNRFKHPCTDHALFEPAPGPGIDELLAALASQPGIEAGPITDVTVDGYRGKSVELTVATDITTCPVDTGEDPLSGFWLWASPNGDRRYVQASDETDRIYAVDIDGTRFTFAARIPAGTAAEDLAALEAIIDSIDIQPGPAASPSP